MKREGYNESFDKESMIDTSSNKQNSQEEEFRINRALKERLAKFPMNLVEFFVGVGLLLFCWNYIQNHPAERSSLFTGLEVIVEKTKIKISQRTTGTGPELEDKFQLVRTFDEIISLANSTKECLTKNDIDKIQRAKAKLEALSVEEFLKQKTAFTTVANLFYSKIKQECSNQQ